MKLLKLLFVSILFALPLLAQTGKTVSTVSLLDVYDNPKNIPYIGEKVLVVMYTDPDVSEYTDAISDAIASKKYDKAKYNSIGIANCKETWIPNALIRSKAKSKQEKFPNSVIMLDEDRVLSEAWGLGDCNEKVAFLIIGKDKKVKYFKHINSVDEGKSIISTITGILDKELK